MTMGAARMADVRAGVRIEILTVAWMVIEAVMSIGAGIAARSPLLIAFGVDSVIELISGSVLLWRLSIEANGGEAERGERTERVAAWIVAVTLGLLCLYVLGTSLYSLLAHARPDASLVGIAVSAAAVLVMPWLSWRKRDLASRIGSEALEGDAVESLTCAYMAATVLVGVGLNALFGWWWIEGIAGLAFLFWLGRETREAIHEAREGEEAREGP
jgi:divalent metal cation (Fe/Co/Zn/Cd) transporter